MFLNKNEFYKDQSEASHALLGILNELSYTEVQLLQKILTTVFLVRSALIDLENRSGPNPMKRRAGGNGLSDICITACEDFLIPALIKQNIACHMEIRQYVFKGFPEGFPRIHAFVTTLLGRFELILDVDADPFYDENVGVFISTERAGLYSLGSLVHKRWITELDKIEKFEVYTWRERRYFVGKNIPYLTLQYYFMDSDSNQCPICLSPSTTMYFSYAHAWRGDIEYDLIELIMVSKRKDEDQLLWNIKFTNLIDIEIEFSASKFLHLGFSDGTETLLSLDSDGYPVSSNIIEYKNDIKPLGAPVKYSIQSAPTNRLTLPSP